MYLEKKQNKKRNPEQGTSWVEQWKFQLVGAFDWQVGAVCGGGGSSQSSVTEDESSYGKAEFPLRLEISVCEAPGSPLFTKTHRHALETCHLFSWLYTENDSWVFMSVQECSGSLVPCNVNPREKVNKSSCVASWLFLVFCIVESPVYSGVNRQHDYVSLLWSNHTREGGQRGVNIELAQLHTRFLKHVQDFIN